MNNEKEVHQGEILMLLVRRSGKEGAEVANAMGINQSYLSRLYKSKKLTNKVKASACRVLGVDIPIFETGLGYDVLDKITEVRESSEQYESLKKEVEALRAEVKRLAEENERERGLSEDLRKLLLKLTKDF